MLIIYFGLFSSNEALYFLFLPLPFARKFLIQIFFRLTGMPSSQHAIFFVLPLLGLVRITIYLQVVQFALPKGIAMRQRVNKDIFQY